jgi:PGF-CTERM protein
MAHKDSDNDKTYDFGVSEGEDDGPYTASDGSPVTDDAVVSISTPTEEPTTEPPTEPPTTEPPTEPPGPTPTPTTSPGFGLIVALLALAGAALLARRRN